MSLTGNKGEWSEAYVLLKLLGDGRIYAADGSLNRIDDMYFPILKIIREEVTDSKYEYAVDDSGRVEVYFNNSLVRSVGQKEFTTEAKYLYDKMVGGGTGDRAFAIVRTESFLNGIGCHKLKAPSKDKTDITMQIHDIQTGYEPICGFSIKSEVGSPPTLLNASGATNFRFEVVGLSPRKIEEINSINPAKRKIQERMKRIFGEAASVKFDGMDKTFEENLIYIDSQFIKVLAWSLYFSYRDDMKDCVSIVEKLERVNPLNTPLRGFYRHKFKEFLCSIALGMMPSKKWNGLDEANGGYVVVTKSGKVLAFHIYNRDSFKKYLLQNTRYERGSTTKHNFARLYSLNGKTYVNLNLQIRFK